jgi:hypothetical protein
VFDLSVNDWGYFAGRGANFSLKIRNVERNRGRIGRAG